MSGQIIEESRFLLYCFVSGIVITIVYDVFRILRRIIRHGTVLIALEDLLFWIVAAAFLFYMLYMTNNGIIRWFSVAGAGAGMLVYKYTVGEHLVQIMSTVVNQVQNLVLRCLKFFLRPIKRLIKRACGKIKRDVRKLKKIMKKKLTGNIKKVNIVLCKHKNGRKRKGKHKKKKKSRKNTKNKKDNSNTNNNINYRYGELR